MEDSKGHCIICNEVIENPEIHALCDRNHDKLLMQVMFLEKDENAAKEVAQTGEIEQTKNDPIKTKVKKQERVLNEIEITEDKVTNEEIVLKKGDTGATYYFCNVCYIRIYKNDINIHCNNWKHQSNAKLDSHYLFVYSYALRKLKCIVCNIFFSVDAMREHLSSSNHESTYNALLAANYLKKSTRNVFCDICIVYMRIGNEIVHIESSGHARLLMSKNTPIAEPAKGQSSDDNNSQKKISKTKHVKSTKKTKQNSSNVPLKKSKGQMKNDFCVIWKDEPIQNIPAITDSKSLVIKENNSKNTTPKVGNDANTSSVIENKNAQEKQVTCKVCDVTMLDNEEDIKNHLLYYHNIIYDAKQVMENSKLKLTGNVLICESCCEYVAIEEELKHLASPTHIVKSLIKTSTDSISHTENVLTNDDRNNNEIPSTSKNTQPISNEENLENKGQVYCLVCTTSLPNGPNSVKIHEDGKKHTANLKLLMSKNNITKRNDHLECEICAVPLEESDLFVHINSLTHLKSKVNTKPGVTTITYCEVCNKYITTKMETHILSITHKSKEIPKSIASYLCHVCDVLLTNSDMNITEHKKGGQHRNNLKILEANTIRINVDKCYCETCDMEFTFKLIRQHISTSQHLILMGNDVPQ